MAQDSGKQEVTFQGSWHQYSMSDHCVYRQGGTCHVKEAAKERENKVLSSWAPNSRCWCNTRAASQMDNSVQAASVKAAGFSLFNYNEWMSRAMPGTSFIHTSCNKHLSSIDSIALDNFWSTSRVGMYVILPWSFVQTTGQGHLDPVWAGTGGIRRRRFKQPFHNHQPKVWPPPLGSR